jgi:ADP-ribose pyrophosphatase
MNPQEQENPWTFLSTELRYDNPWIRVEEHQVLNPAGNQGIYGVVSFKNIAVGIVPIDEDGNTWLVGQYRYPLGVYSWEIIEGGGGLAMDTLPAAQRELKEETGLEASEWEEILRLNTSNSVTDERAVVYVARGLSYGPSSPEETELLSIKKLPLSEAIAMAIRGDIQDSISLAALLKLGLMGITR